MITNSVPDVTKGKEATATESIKLRKDPVSSSRVPSQGHTIEQAIVKAQPQPKKKSRYITETAEALVLVASAQQLPEQINSSAANNHSNYEENLVSEKPEIVAEPISHSTISGDANPLHLAAWTALPAAPVGAEESITHQKESTSYSEWTPVLGVLALFGGLAGAALTSGSSSGSASATTPVNTPHAPVLKLLVDTSPAAGSTVTIGGTADAGASVAIYEGTILLGVVTADIQGSFSYTIDSSKLGTRAITAIATNSAGSSQLSETMFFVSGMAADGPLQNAIIYDDRNGNNKFDVGESQVAVSDASGRFHFSTTSNPSNLKISGVYGSEIETHAPNLLQLTAPAGYFLLSPLSTLISHVAAQAGVTTVAQAETIVEMALHLAHLDYKSTNVNATLGTDKISSSIAAAAMFAPGTDAGSTTFFEKLATAITNSKPVSANQGEVDAIIKSALSAAGGTAAAATSYDEAAAAIKAADSIKTISDLIGSIQIDEITRRNSSELKNDQVAALTKEQNTTIAINAISDAAEANDATATVPPVATYTAAGVTGVTSSNLAAINSALDSAAVTGAATHSTAKIQTVVDAYQTILTGADGNASNNNSIATASQYTAIGVTGVTTPVASLLNDVIDGLNTTAVDTIAEIQALATGAATVISAAGGGAGPTLMQLTALGITGVTTSNLATIQAAIAATVDSGSGVDTLAELQQVVTAAVDKTAGMIAAATTAGSTVTSATSALAGAESTLATAIGALATLATPAQLSAVENAQTAVDIAAVAVKSAVTAAQATVSVAIAADNGATQLLTAATSAIAFGTSAVSAASAHTSASEAITDAKVAALVAAAGTAGTEAITAATNLTTAEIILVTAVIALGTPATVAQLNNVIHAQDAVDLAAVVVQTANASAQAAVTAANAAATAAREAAPSLAAVTTAIATGTSAAAAAASLITASETTTDTKISELVGVATTSGSAITNAVNALTEAEARLATAIDAVGTPASAAQLSTVEKAQAAVDTAAVVVQTAAAAAQVAVTVANTAIAAHEAAAHETPPVHTLPIDHDVTDVTAAVAAIAAGIAAAAAAAPITQASESFTDAKVAAVVATAIASGSAVATATSSLSGAESTLAAAIADLVAPATPAQLVAIEAAKSAVTEAAATVIAANTTAIAAVADANIAALAANEAAPALGAITDAIAVGAAAVAAAGIGAVLSIITTAAQSNGTLAAALTIANYSAAGITGVTSGNLAAINSVLASPAITGANTDTVSEVQTIVDSYSAILAAADGIDNNSSNPTQAQYRAIGITGINGVVTESLLGDVLDIKASSAINSVAALQPLADTVSKIMLQAAGTTQNITQTELETLGITNLTPERTTALLSAIAATVDNGSGVDTLAEIQALVDIAAPPAPIISIIAGDDIVNSVEQTGTITGTSEANATITLTVASGTSHTVTADASGTWSYTLASADMVAMGQGAATVSAIASDASGNISAAGTRMISIDTLAPSVSGVALSGATGTISNTLNAGDVVSATVTMSEATVITGTPTLGLNIGGTIVQAHYVSGSGTSELVFSYTILSAQTDANGVSIAANSLEPGDGTLKDAAGNVAVLDHALVADNAGYQVDTTAPSISSVHLTDATGSPLTVGDVVHATVAMSEATFVTGTPHLALTIGGATVQADYVSGSGSTNLEFSYTILAGQTDADGISIAANSLSLGFSVLTDIAGNAAVINHVLESDNSGYLVDTIAPTATLGTSGLHSSFESATVQSTEVGTAYLVNNSDVVSSVDQILALDSSHWNSVAVGTPNSDTALNLAGLTDGSYHLYTADAAHNLSAAVGSMEIGIIPTFAPVLAAAQALDNVTNLDVTSALVVNFDQDISLGTGQIKIFDDMGTSGWTNTNTTTGESKQDTFDNDVVITLAAGVVTGFTVGGIDKSAQMAGSVTVSGNHLIINPSGDHAATSTAWNFDWDFGANYHVNLDAGVVVNGSNQGIAAVSDATTLNFTTVAPAADAIGAASQKMNVSSGALETGLIWHNASVQDATSTGLAMDFSSGGHALVIQTDGGADTGTNVGFGTRTTTISGRVLLSGFGTNDVLYNDNMGNINMLTTEGQKGGSWTGSGNTMTRFLDNSDGGLQQQVVFVDYANTHFTPVTSLAGGDRIFENSTHYNSNVVIFG